MSLTRRTLATRVLSRAADSLRLLAFLAFEYILPKRSDWWCFCTWNTPYAHTIDNPRGVFEAIKADASVRKIILLKPHHQAGRSSAEDPHTSFVNVESLRGAYLLARSRVLLLGYGLQGLCSFGRHITDRHTIIQLWHGIPLKRIGKLFPGESFWDSETRKYAATICSAAKDRDFMAAAFAPTPNVWLTGLPRNDLILGAESALPRDYQDQLASIRQRLAGRRLLLYAPTWRNHDSGIYPFSASQLDALHALLTRHDAVIGIRAHANRRPQEPAHADGMGERIFFVNEIPDANLLLRLAEVLITDYSSIYIDFLLTGRPILNFTYDLQAYLQERGFLYDLPEAMPDEPLRTFEELLARLDATLGGQYTRSDRYEQATALFHGHAGSAAAAVSVRIREAASGKTRRRV